ncbi:MAG: SMI1/KNR4 family protein [Anaerolineae bacterium]|nr:SMI1/KNR4 family protein [Anaerolineae bacterium]
MSTEFLQNVTAITERLRTLDTRRVVFGSSHHAYRFNPPLGREQVDEFEHIHNVSLPVPYRRFITEIGNGGAGPFYGIMPLELNSPQLLQPFPSTQPFKPGEDNDEESFVASIPGSILLAEYGCGIFILLVVRGEAAGEDWFDARYEGGISPAVNGSGARMTFDTWWLAVMGAHLERFERILALMKAATPHEDIHHMLEPGVLQLEVDDTMLSIMNQNPKDTPKVSANKP